jgi:predicted CxxxxCH...CXXCH cytochrome family protein
MTPDHLFDSTAGRSEVVFNYGLSPNGQYSAPGCSDLYCHGTGLANGSAATFIPAGGLTCESCHPAATQSVSHVFHTFAPCSTCHLDVVGDSGVISNPDLHVNGAVEVRMSSGTWIAETNTCSDSACHPGDITW